MPLKVYFIIRRHRRSADSCSFRPSPLNSPQSVWVRRRACDLSVRSSIGRRSLSDWLTDGRSTVLCWLRAGVRRDSPTTSPPSSTTTTTTASWKRRRPDSHGHGHGHGGAGGLSMLSRGHEYHLAPGSLLSLDCEFYMQAFHAFHNPVIWVKAASSGSSRSRRRLMAARDASKLM